MTDGIDALTEKFSRLGVDDPGAWARSEAEEGLAQLAAVRLATLIRKRIMSREGTIEGAVANLRAAKERGRETGAAHAVLERCLDAGITPTELETLIGAAVREACFEFAYLLDDPYDDDLGNPDDLPGWALRERSPERESGELTGRTISGLHEYLGPDPL